MAILNDYVKFPEGNYHSLYFTTHILLDLFFVAGFGHSSPMVRFSDPGTITRDSAMEPRKIPKIPSPKSRRPKKEDCDQAISRGLVEGVEVIHSMG